MRTYRATSRRPDRLLSASLWLVVMSMIAISALGALVLIYRGIFAFVTAEFESGGILMGCGAAVGLFCFRLCKHSDELIDRG